MFAKVSPKRKVLEKPPKTNILFVSTQNEKIIGPGYYSSLIFRIKDYQLIFRLHKTYDVSSEGCYLYHSSIVEHDSNISKRALATRY